MSTPSVDIDSHCVIELILQYLQETNLTESYDTLSRETRVSTNTISNKELFMSSIVSGKWDYVLQQITSLKLPKNVFMDLYEQVFFELLEIREMYTANEMINKCEPFVMMKSEREERYLHLQYWLKKSYFDAVEAYPAGETKESRRQKLASVISSYITIAPSSRLLTLLQQAVCFEKERGILLEGERIDIFRNCTEQILHEDAVPTVMGTTIQFPKGSYPEVVCISPNGQYLVSGSVDGLIEIWDLEKGALRQELEFQKNEKYMAHSKSVLSLSFSNDSEYLASGDLDGTIKVWRVRSGGLLRRFSNVHDGGITNMCFHINGQQICSSSYDGTVRIHGLKSGKTLKVMRGHTSYVNSVCYTVDQQHIMSASSDGSIRIWDVATAECNTTILPAKAAQSFADISVMQGIPLIQNPDMIVVIAKLNTAYVMTMSGRIVFTMKTDRDNVQFLFGCLSPHGKFIYCISDDGYRYCFNSDDGEFIEKRKLAEHELLGACHYPNANIMITYSQKGEITSWKTCIVCL